MWCKHLIVFFIENKKHLKETLHQSFSFENNHEFSKFYHIDFLTYVHTNFLLQKVNRIRNECDVNI